MNCSGRNWPVKPDNPPHEISTVKRLLFTGLAMLAMTASTYSADKISTRDRRRQDARLLRSQASYVHRTDRAMLGRLHYSHRSLQTRWSLQPQPDSPSDRGLEPGISDVYA